MVKLKKKIELLAPAGDLERLKTAVVFGADAIYCGLPSWSLRNAREITFNLETLKEGIKFAHAHKVKVYLTFNIFPHEAQLENIEKNLLEIRNLKLEIDGIILSDLGMLSLVKKILPKIPIHVSTQANTLNSEAVKMWGKLGAERVVLARETTLEEIKKIKNKLGESLGQTSGSSPRSDLGTRSIELEVFGHGAMCMAYSGRCLLSKYFTGREANLGDCAQSCRWRYRVKCQITNNKLQTNSKSQIQNKITSSQDNNFYFLEEETRPDDLLEVQEDANGTYFMNSKEICSIDILDQFIESGIDSLKIEGRAKTVYYLATVVGAYRKAIDAYYAYCHPRASVVLNRKLVLDSDQGSRIFNENREKYKKLVKELFAELNMVQNRGYSHGFLTGRHDYEQEYKIAAFKPPVLFLGVVLENQKSSLGNTRDKQIKDKKSGMASPSYLVEVKNKFKVGEKIEIVTPKEIIKTKILEIKLNTVGANGRSPNVDEILKPAEKVWVKLESRVKNQELRIPERSILRRRS